MTWLIGQVTIYRWDTCIEPSFIYRCLVNFDNRDRVCRYTDGSMDCIISPSFNGT